MNCVEFQNISDFLLDWRW